MSDITQSLIPQEQLLAKQPPPGATVLFEQTDQLQQHTLLSAQGTWHLETAVREATDAVENLRAALAAAFT